MPTEDPLAAPPSPPVHHERQLTSTNIHQVYLLTLDQEEMVYSRSCSTEVSEDATTMIGEYIGSVANLCSATLGAGVLALPIAFFHAGILVGLLLLLFSGLATAASITLIYQACEYYKLYTYESLVERLFGKKLRKLIEIAIVVFCGGTMVAYVIAVGDIMQQSHLVVENRAISMTFMWAVCMLPLSLLRTMESLQYASAIGIASIGTLIFAAFIYLITDEDDYEHYRQPFNVTPGGEMSDDTIIPGFDQLDQYLWPAKGAISVLSACPIVFFAFSCQVNVCAIYQELGERKHLMPKVTWTAVGICTFLYCSISIIALANFGSSVTPNILSSYESKGIMQVASMFMCVAVLMAFPLNVFPARVTLSHVLAPDPPPNRSQAAADATLTAALLEDQEQGQSETSPLQGIQRQPRPSSTQVSDYKTLSTTQHVLLTVLIAGTALVLAILVPDISVVFGLIGGTATSVLGFCVPGLLGLKLAHDRQDWSSSWIAWSLLVGGGIIGIVTTGVTVYATFW